MSDSNLDGSQESIGIFGEFCDAASALSLSSELPDLTFTESDQGNFCSHEYRAEAYEEEDKKDVEGKTQD